MARQAMLVVMIIGFWVLSVGHAIGAEPKKMRTDLTGRLNLTPEEVDVLPALKDGASTAAFPSPIESSGTTWV
jgi:hypothetical protein